MLDARLGRRECCCSDTLTSAGSLGLLRSRKVRQALIRVRKPPHSHRLFTASTEPINPITVPQANATEECRDSLRLDAPTVGGGLQIK